MKSWSVLMCSILLMGTLAACGNKTEDAQTATTDKPAQTETKTETPAAEEPAAEEPAAEEPAAGDLQDGMYFAQGDMDEESGWQPYVILQVEGGKIADATWSATSINAGPDKKTYSEEGKYGMKAGGASSEWHEQAEKVEQYLIDNQDPAKITTDAEGHTDVVSGVSVHVNDFTKLAEEALAAGPVEAGPYKDGAYHAEAADFDAESGWKETADVTVVAGKIAAVNFSGVNKDGDDKKAYSKDGKYGMKEKGGAQAEWHEEAQKAEQYVIEKQDPAAVETKEDGTTDAISGVTIHVASYLQLAEQALKDAK
ncbi:FMN-binding protein [Saccharibacillus sp. CPCC 101409]|uniref:FMN-binding protein n=1 Tax=Saccharibacillus sp. CPCC 101409 TaxID=3058041 RepID=UPI0026718506|nr:FMN-binding protein [Saccharibacillus sp. CPCC 101409]MDO3411440.1 FMN-binding protein [Saccharibacillus sp. CPCC 101409]